MSCSLFLQILFLILDLSYVFSKIPEDGSIPVNLENTNTKGSNGDPCSMPKELTVNVVLTNGTVFYKLNLQSKDNQPGERKPMYSIRSTQTLQPFLVRESRSPLQKSTMYSSFTEPATLVEVQCSRQGDNAIYKYNGMFTRNGTEYMVVPGVSGVHYINPLPPSTGRQHDYRVLPGDNIVQRITESMSLQKLKFRSRRQLTAPHVIDLLVVIDHKIYEDWFDRSSGSSPFDKEQRTKANIQTYYSHFLNEVDLRYQGIRSSDLNFRVRVAALLLADKSDSYPWTELKKEPGTPRELLNADEALKDFRSWINNSNDLPFHDHAILFTGYNLYSSDGFQKKLHTAGLAFIGSMCRRGGDSVSIVEDHGGFQNIATAAHEIGHSLGSLHDGEDNFCNPNDRYIMSSSENTNSLPPAKRTNQWHFSTCTLNYFREFLSTSYKNGLTCLSDSLVDQSVASLVPPGQIYSPDDQCKLIWGPQSYLCRGSEFGDAESICTAMYCRDPSSGNDCVQHTAARGTSCANKKWCEEGVCTFSEKAPERDEKCVLGDQPGIAFINKTCDELINELPQYCYKEKVQARCCSSCAEHFSWIAGCEYGDRVLGCKEFHCNMVEDPKVLTDCCKTCSYGTLIPTTPAPDFSVRPFPTDKPSEHRPHICTDFAEINGKSCRSFISERGRHSCYDNRIAAYCCATCRTMLSIRSPDCPYGDRLPGFCSQQVNVTDRWCNNFRPHCCDTCSISSAHNVFSLSLPSVFIAVILLVFSL